MLRRILSALAVLLVAAILYAFTALPGRLESGMNVVRRQPPYPVSERARALIRRAPIVDFHVDSLLWNRDLLERGTRGHSDVPRMIEGGYGLQAFSVVSKTPHGLNFYHNSGDTLDDILPLSIIERWPRRTWTSLCERALYLASKFRNTVERSNGKLVMIRSRADLAGYLERRKSDPGITAGFLSIEGAQVLEGKLDNLARLDGAGFRMISPAHFFDTEIGGSAAGMEQGGLTPLGKEWVRQMESRRMLIDIAHASARTIDDVLAMAARPVIASHTGVKGTCDNPRNLSDDQLRRVAKTGGLIAITFFEFAVCGKDAPAIARAIRHAAEVTGIDHVALGSDFDGAVDAPFDTTGVGLLVDALLSPAGGFSEEDTAKIIGGNAFRVLGETLP
jgi:membrane dipeptidase